MLLHLAVRNLLRHRLRTATTLAAVAFGVAAMILAGGFVRDLYFQLGESLIRSQSGHLQVGRPAIFAQGSRVPEQHLISSPEGLQARLDAIPGVMHTMARLNFSGLLNNGKVDVPVVGEGIEPGPEAKLASSVSMLSGRQLSDEDRRGVLVGEGLAKSLKLAPGDTATIVASTIDGAMNTGEFEVVGVFRSFSRDYDDRAIKMQLSAAQDLLATTDANLIVVLLDATEKTGGLAIAAQNTVATDGLVVKRWEEINDFYANTVALYDRQFAVLRLIILVMVLLAVANAVNMSVFERLSEFGTMRALGNRGGFVATLILVECGLLGAAGAIVGALAGASVAAVISQLGIPMPPPPNSNAGYMARIQLLPDVVGQAMAVGAAAALLSGVMPGLRARGTSIVDALRSAH